MVAPISGMDLILKPADPDDIDVPGATTYLEAGTDDMPTEEWLEEVSDLSDEECLAMWHRQKEYIFEHRRDPISLFNTEDEETDSTQKVKKLSYGPTNRPVLERSDRFTKLGHQIGKVISLQYMIDSELDLAEAADQVPFSVPEFDLDIIERFFEHNEAAWVYAANGPGLAGKFPISSSTTYSGMIYFMYTLNPTGQEIPRYIGMSQKLGRDDKSLGSNFAGITRDSVFGRWGYGESQHLGELSRVIFSEHYSKAPQQKYMDWADALFIDRTQNLNDPVYIEMVPFFDASIKDAEEKLIRLAHRVFEPFLLNKEYASD